jgi:hypothetical protein
VRDLILGLLVCAAWIFLQFGTARPSGWIRLLLILGVGLVIRGIVVRTPGKSAAS